MKSKKRTQRQINQTSVAGRLLIEIFEAIKHTFPTEDSPVMIWKYGHEGARRIRDVQEKKRRYQALKRLESRKLIKINKVAKSFQVALTEDGDYQVFSLKAKQAGFLYNDIVCLVVFDIPETHRALRKRLRHLLYDVGFIPIQRSVWVSPYDVSKELVSLFRKVKAHKWVRVYNAKEIVD